MEEVSVVKKNYIQYINNVVQQKKVSHAYLIEMNDDSVDFCYILDFIKMILCDCSYEELDQLDSNVVRLIDQNNYPDIKVIEPDGNVIKKEQLIQLQKDFDSKSLLNNKKIYIIKNAEKLNQSSANTMLKFLEEPEKDIIGFLVTNNRYNVLETIQSRCQILSLKDGQSISYLEEQFFFLKSIVFPKDFFLKYNDFITNIVEDKQTMKNFLLQSEQMLIDYLHYQYFGDKIDQRLIDILKKTNTSKILHIISVIEGEIQKLKYNINYKLWIDGLLSRLISGE